MIIIKAKVNNIPSINTTYRRNERGVFKSKNVKEYQKIIKTYALVSMKNNKQQLFITPLEIEIIFYVKNIQRDLDNMLKATLDALQGIVFRNDNQIMIIHTYKQLSTDIVENVEICIKELK